jgi:hypothetical protein
MAWADTFGMLGLISIACIVLVLWLWETPVALAKDVERRQ